MEHNIVEILLVEDNMNDAELAIRAFRKGNIKNNLIHLKDGTQALEFLFGTGKFEGRDINMKPKVILLDLKMPKMDGLEVLTHIKAHHLTRAIPVVVLTSSKELPDVERAYALGANSYIVKPVELDELSKVVVDLRFYWLQKNHPSV